MGIFDKLFRRQSAGSEAQADVAGEEALCVLSGHEAEISAVGFVLGGKLLLTGDTRGKVMAWKAPSFERHFELGHEPPAPIYCFAGGDQGDVYYGRGAAVKQWKTGAGFLDDLSELQSFTLGEAHSKEVVPVLSTARELISGGYDGKLCFWDRDSGEARAGSLKSPILSLACTSGALYEPEAGGLLAAGHEDGTVTIFDLEKHEPLGRFKAHERDVYAVSFQNVVFNRQILLATCSPADRVVRVWKNDQVIAEFEAPGFTATFSPDGRFLAHGDGTQVVIREGREWKVVRRLAGHRYLVSALAFSPSDSLEARWAGWLASGSHDRTVRVWSFDDDTETAEQIGAPPQLPPEWGWCRVHVRDAQLKALGYYYRDRHAGPSVNILVDLSSPLGPELIRSRASSAGYRGSSTFRLAAHETIQIEGLPADFAAMMRTRYEQCDGPAGAVVLKLTAAERAEYGLPDSPPWIATYL
ncbi:MAG: hypothetical protein JXR96_01305 [Deltaproteobacteria bacterium]|nr:hypothetical protein [Deltaproteobacteria bacterium]